MISGGWGCQPSWAVRKPCQTRPSFSAIRYVCTRGCLGKLIVPYVPGYNDIKLAFPHRLSEESFDRRSTAEQLRINLTHLQKRKEPLKVVLQPLCT